MDPRSELLALELAAALGSEAVQQDPTVLRAFAVDGKIPHIRCGPHDAAGVADVLRLCVKHGAAVVPWGGGTAMHLGNIPRQFDVALSLEHLHDLIEHDDANLTATAQAGITVAHLADVLGRKRQFLAIDPPHPARATLGGVVAADSNGPRRMFYGGVRDLVIGMKVVLATGEQIKAGGKVVKNVAGYDMCKLFVGSLGTLGVISEVTFRMAPVPEATATIIARGRLDQLTRFVDALFESPLVLAAMTILSETALFEAGWPGGAPALAISVEGFEEAVARHVADVQTMAAQQGLTDEVLPSAAAQRLWAYVREFGGRTDSGGDPAVTIRMTVPLAAVAPTLAAIGTWRLGGPASYLAHAGTGTVLVMVPGADGAAAWFNSLTALVHTHGGHAVLTSAPPAVKQAVDVWDSPPHALSIMREVKRQFDPNGLLNPGRFVARL